MEEHVSGHVAVVSPQERELSRPENGKLRDLKAGLGSLENT
jgi:hypothetical protein